jgi:hypothetical protein
MKDELLKHTLLSANQWLVEDHSTGEKLVAISLRISTLTLRFVIA